MSDASGFDSVVGALNTSLNLRLLNHNVIGSNIANADTPGYKAKAVEFERAFREALQSGTGLKMERVDGESLGPSDTNPIEPVVYEVPNAIETLDGNTVDRSAEMAKLAENQLMYDASAEMLKRKLGILKYSINEGGNR
jgi:flagellar basal-body rod protein FlgB